MKSSKLSLDLDPTVDVPLYAQIVGQLVEQIRTGRLVPGLQLPPTRHLAAQLGAHRNTVVRAYVELEKLGMVTSTVGRGTFVAEPQPPHEPVLAENSGMPWQTLVSRAAQAEPLGRYDRATRRLSHNDPIDLAGMQPSPSLVPVEAFRASIDRCFEELGAGALRYAPRDGEPRLRQAIASMLRARHLAVAADDVVITTGSQQALDLIARALIDPGDAVLVESETYSGALNCFAAAGARLVAVPTDDEGPDPAALERFTHGHAKLLYVMPDCHNPTARVMSADRRGWLNDWSRRARSVLLEDDFAADLCLDPEAIALRPLRAQSGDVLYIGTFSKKLIPALRVGFVICPQGLRAKLVSLKHAMDLGTSSLLQHALADFIERGELASHLERILPEYRARCRALVRGLAKNLPGTRAQMPRQGLGLWLPIDAPLQPEAVFEEAARHGALVSPGYLHTPSGVEPAGIRLTFCNESPARLHEGAERIGRALRALSHANHNQRAERPNIGVV